MKRQVELLAPAGSLESLKAAVCAGADAVYAGGSRFGARAYAKNLSEEELLGAIDYVHIHGRRIYLTVNTLLKDSEIEQLYEYLLPYYLRGVDGVIVQDIGVIEYLRMHFPDLPLHASTQMTITGAKGAAFLKSQGITRVVPARELSLGEIRRMKRKTGLEIECFVHGALCYCYSGQCLLSSMIGGRSGNRGQCAQPCRLPYSVNGKKQADVMSLKDLCTIDMIPELVEAGIDSFKIEGRMKQPDYVYTVVSMHRKYIDLYLQKGAGNYKIEQEDRDRLLGAYRRRGYTDGYYNRRNGKEMISFGRPAPKDGLSEKRSLAEGMQSARRSSQTEEKKSTCPDYKLQEKINGNLILFPGERAKLVLEYLTCRVECEGELVQPAMRQPLDEARAAKQMRKTGNTEFCFDRLDIEMKGEVFLPMQAVNELRREGLAGLEESVLAHYRRKQPERPQMRTGSQEIQQGRKQPERSEMRTGSQEMQQGGGQPERSEEGEVWRNGRRLGIDVGQSVEGSIYQRADLRRDAEAENMRSGTESGYREKKTGEGTDREVCMSCLVQTRDQLEEAVSCGHISVIYVDSELGLKDETRRLIGRNRDGRRYYLALPYICRGPYEKQWESLYELLALRPEAEDCGGGCPARPEEENRTREYNARLDDGDCVRRDGVRLEAAVYDGVLVRNWESFMRLRELGRGKDICLDQNLYVFNRYGKTFIKRQGTGQFTAPAELNARELESLDIRGAVMNVYGYQPVMVTANCIRRSVDGCRKKEGYTFIRDRYKKQFAVRTCCRYCYNVIYNSAPLYLADKAKEVMGLSPGELRLDFTVETREEAREVIRLYIDAFIYNREVEAPGTEYTRGHFGRGVK